MTPKQILKKLESLTDDKMRAIYRKRGERDDLFGVKLGDIRKIAKELKSDHPLALKLWETGQPEARLLATLMMKPRQLSTDELDAFVRDADYLQLADWLNAYVVKKHPRKESLREQWMDDDDPLAARAGWALTAERVAKSPDGLNLPALLKRIEKELAKAPEASQWTMNICLAEIGIHHETHRKRALAIGEKLGVYRDYPTPKGCTSPFAPEWINAMVRRQG